MRFPILTLLLFLFVPTLVAGCDSVEKGIEAGQMAAATLEHMATESERLLPESPADESAARSAVASALREMAGQTNGDANLVQAVVVVIRGRVETWDVPGQQAIVDALRGFEDRLAAGEVTDVPSAVEEVATEIESGTTP